MRLKIILTVFRKEIKDISRDKRALLISVLIPLLLFPASFFAMNLNLKTTAGALDRGIPAYIEIKDEKLKTCISREDRIIHTDSPAPSDSLVSGKIAIIVTDQKSHEGRITVIFDNTSQFSTAAVEIACPVIQSCVSGKEHSSDEVIDTGLSIEPLIDPDKGSGIMTLQLLLPMLIFVFSAASPMAVSADIFAGEKERGTLENLLALPVSPSELLAGKYSAALCAGLVGVCAFMSGIALSFVTSPDLFGADNISLAITPAAAAVTALFSLFILMVFTAAEFLISIFARTVREAQILFLPVIIVALAIGQSIAMIDVKRIDIIFRYIPALNSGLIIKETVAGIYNPGFMAAAALSCLILSVVILRIARIMLTKEKTLYSKS